MVINHLLNGMILQVVKIFTYGGFDSPSPKKNSGFQLFENLSMGEWLVHRFFWGGGKCQQNANQIQQKWLYIHVISYTCIYIYMYERIWDPHIHPKPSRRNCLVFSSAPQTNQQIMHVFPSHIKTIRWNHHAFNPPQTPPWMLDRPLSEATFFFGPNGLTRPCGLAFCFG